METMDALIALTSTVTSVVDRDEWCLKNFPVEISVHFSKEEKIKAMKGCWDLYLKYVEQRQHALTEQISVKDKSNTNGDGAEVVDIQLNKVVDVFYNALTCGYELIKDEGGMSHRYTTRPPFEDDLKRPLAYALAVKALRKTGLVEIDQPTMNRVSGYLRRTWGTGLFTYGYVNPVYEGMRRRPDVVEWITDSSYQEEDTTKFGGDVLLYISGVIFTLMLCREFTWSEIYRIVPEKVFYDQIFTDKYREKNPAFKLEDMSTWVAIPQGRNSNRRVYSCADMLMKAGSSLQKHAYDVIVWLSLRWCRENNMDMLYVSCPDYLRPFKYERASRYGLYDKQAVAVNTQ